MKVINRILPVTPYLEVKLDQMIVDYLWKIIAKSEVLKESHKTNLAGNISESYKLNDLDNFFYKKVCVPLVNQFRQVNKGSDPIVNSVNFEKEPALLLDGFWVNYQYQNEFNPFHDHGGVYSFAVWLKIPYDWREQHKLAQFSGMNELYKKPGNFEFEYIDSLGGIRNIGYQLYSGLEGTMLFFPAKLRHCVYPFYGTSDPRISIAGNLAFTTRINRK